MMMPANFSVIAENEMTYVDGGATALATFGKNLVTITGNTYMSRLLSATLGTLFSGNYLAGGLKNGVFAAIGNAITGNGAYDFINSAMQVIGLGAAGYQLATVDAVPVVDDDPIALFTID